MYSFLSLEIIGLGNWTYAQIWIFPSLFGEYFMVFSLLLFW